MAEKITRSMFAKEIAEYLGYPVDEVKAVQIAMSTLMKKHLQNGDSVQLMTGIKMETFYVPERQRTLPTGEIVTVKEHYNIKPVLSMRLRKMLRRGNLFKDYDYDGTWKDNRSFKEYEYPDI